MNIPKLIKAQTINQDESNNSFRREKDNFDYGTFSNLLNVSGIYVITNKENNLKYIGSSTDIGRRLQKHFSLLRHNEHPNKKLQEDYIKFKGIEVFNWECIEITDTNLLNKEREYQIKTGIDNLYNDKISNYYMSDELRQKYANVSKDSHRTKEYREKMSILKSNSIAQYKLDGTLIKIYSRMNDIIAENPKFKPQPIRGVCNGSKKTAYGFIWRYVKENNN